MGRVTRNYTDGERDVIIQLSSIIRNCPGADLLAGEEIEEVTVTDDDNLKLVVSEPTGEQLDSF